MDLVDEPLVGTEVGLLSRLRRHAAVRLFPERSLDGARCATAQATRPRRRRVRAGRSRASRWSRVPPGPARPSSCVALAWSPCPACGAGSDPTVLRANDHAAEPPARLRRPHARPAPRPRPTAPATATARPSLPAPHAQPCDAAAAAASSARPSPSRWTTPTRPAGTVGLALIRLPAAREGAAGSASLVVNPGGPGVSAVDYLPAACDAARPDAVRDRFDLVAFDPRGVGRSRAGALRARPPSSTRYFAVDPAPDDAAELRALEQANAELRRRLRSSGPATAAAARLDRRRRPRPGPASARRVGDEQAHLPRLLLRHRARRGLPRPLPDQGARDGARRRHRPALTWDQLLEGQSKGFDRALRGVPRRLRARRRCAYRDAGRGRPRRRPTTGWRPQVEPRPLPGRRRAATVGPGELSLGVGAGLYSRANGWPALADALVAGRARATARRCSRWPTATSSRGDNGYAQRHRGQLSRSNCLDRPWPRETAAYLALADAGARRTPRASARRSRCRARLRRLAGAAGRHAARGHRRRAPRRSSSSAPPATRRRRTPGRSRWPTSCERACC